MTLLSDVPADRDPTHLLLISPTKLGKSTYVAQAIKDGFTCLYIDADNGISALRRVLTAEEEKRVIYLRTEHPSKLLRTLLDTTVWRWNVTQDEVFSSGLSKPNDKVIELIPSKMPRSILLVIDSWSSVAHDAMELGAESLSLDLEKMGDKQEQAYGAAGLKLRIICAILQQCKFDVIVQAHSTTYELTEKPLGLQTNVKRRDLKIKEITKIPVSSSRPNGYEMGKYFTDIGWIELDNMSQRILDFTTEAGRIGGGTINKKGFIGEMSYAKLFGPARPCSIDDSWYRSYTAEEFSAKKAVESTKPAVAGTAAPQTIPKPANPMAAFMKKKS